MQCLSGAPASSVVPCKARSSRRPTLVVCAAKQQQKQNTVEYGANWYAQTRAASKPRTVREEIAYRKAANAAANNGRERKDLYTADNWEGSEYKGSNWNILTLLGALFILVPVAGLVFAYQSYGVLWG